MAARKNNIMKSFTENVPGLVVGGVAAKFVNNKLSPQAAEMLPEAVAPLANLIPLLVGAYMADMKGIQGKIGMGMIAVAGADVAEGYVPGITGFDDVLAGVADEVLADDYEDNNYEDYEDEEEEYEDEDDGFPQDEDY